MPTFKQVLTIVLVFAGIFLFYWFQIRPSNIKSTCANETIEKLKSIKEERSADTWQKNYDLYYEACLNKKGL